jgi:hypothetical protein
MLTINALIVLLALTTNLQDTISPVVGDLEVRLLLETKDSPPWAQIRNIGRSAKLVCVRGVAYSTRNRGGGGGLMSHACVDEKAYAVFLPNESYVVRLPGTFILGSDARLSVDVIVLTRPFHARSKSTEPDRSTVIWSGTVEEALETFRRVAGVEQ